MYDSASSIVSLVVGAKGEYPAVAGKREVPRVWSCIVSGDGVDGMRGERVAIYSCRSLGTGTHLG